MKGAEDRHGRLNESCRLYFARGSKSDLCDNRLVKVNRSVLSRKCEDQWCFSVFLVPLFIRCTVHTGILRACFGPVVELDLN